MKNGFTIHDPAQAPEASRALLAKAEEALGKVPNLERVMAEAPALLEAYVATWAMFDTTSLSPAERQVVYQVANLENGCGYCRPWHTALSLQAGMGKAEALRLRDGVPLEDGRLEALRIFTTEVLTTKGQVTPQAMEVFLAAGFTRQSALEIVLGLSIKVMSNYTNALAGTPLDDEVARFRQDAE